MKALVGGAIALVCILGACMGAVAQAQDGSISVGATVLPPPVIHSPHHAAVVTNKYSTVSGSCQQNYSVVLYRNGVLAGSAICPQNKLFTFVIELGDGQNDLVVRHHEQSGQPASEATTITVFYRAIPVPGIDAAPTPAGHPAPFFAPGPVTPSPAFPPHTTASPSLPTSPTEKPRAQLPAAQQHPRFIAIILILLALLLAIIVWRRLDSRGRTSDDGIEH